MNKISTGDYYLIQKQFLRVIFMTSEPWLELSLEQFSVECWKQSGIALD